RTTRTTDELPQTAIPGKPPHMNEGNVMINKRNEFVLGQIARSGLIIDDKLVSEILTGNPPPVESVVNELVVRALDAEAFIRNDKESTWNERRVAITVSCHCVPCSIGLHEGRCSKLEVISPNSRRVRSPVPYRTEGLKDGFRKRFKPASGA